MFYMLFNVYQFLTVALPAAMVYCLRAGRQGANRRAWLIGLLTLYIFAVLHLTGLSTLRDVLNGGLSVSAGQLNLTPFTHTVNRTERTLNVLLFMPLGLLLPLLWPGYRRLWPTLCVGSALSLLIEVSQLFNHRCTDINDLIMNSLGTLLGYVAFKALSLILRPSLDYAHEGRGEALVYLLAMILGRFLLYSGFGIR